MGVLRELLKKNHMVLPVTWARSKRGAGVYISRIGSCGAIVKMTFHLVVVLVAYFLGLFGNLRVEPSLRSAVGVPPRGPTDPWRKPGSARFQSIRFGGWLKWTDMAMEPERGHQATDGIEDRPFSGTAETCSQ